VAIKLRVDKIARLAKTPQDDRTLDQRRADVVCDLLLGKASNVQVHLQVTAPAAMLSVWTISPVNWPGTARSPPTWRESWRVTRPGGGC
jgi:hypothetical protein